MGEKRIAAYFGFNIRAKLSLATLFISFLLQYAWLLEFFFYESEAVLGDKALFILTYTVFKIDLLGTLWYR